MRSRRAAVAIPLGVLALSLAFTGCGAQPAAAPTVTRTPTPTATPTAEAGGVESIAVVGDSMSLAATACGEPTACVEQSWAIGTDAAVDSVATRLGALQGNTPSTTAIAKLGAKASWARGQVAALKAADPDVVLVLLGANDACAPSDDEVTGPDAFAADYAEVLAGVRSSAPGAAIVAYSVPDLLRLWELGRDDPETVEMWQASPSCRSLLADAGSDASDAVARRTAIADLVTSYNASIQAACAATEGCTWDEGAVNATQFELEDVSSLDHFHASAAGQATLAAAAWPVVERALGL